MNTKLQMVKQGRFQSIEEVAGLHIIDFHRCNGLWGNNVFRAMNTVAPWLMGHAYTIIDCDLNQFPVRDDFPDWHHTGSSHKPIGKLFWNFFHCNFKGELQFHDAPDFSGKLVFKDYEAHFEGDIGQVSVSTFGVDVLPGMREGDLWITLLDEHRQIIIEFLDDIGDQIHAHVEKKFGLHKNIAASVVNVEAIEQLYLF